MMGNHFFDELDEVKGSILEADVLSLFFPYFGKAILLDTRSNETDGPVIMLTEMVRRSEEHTSELQSLVNLVCRLLLEKKKHRTNDTTLR